MSVVGEIAVVAGVVGCVAAIVSAYRDGDGIFQGIKAKRAARRASPPPSSLESSMIRAPRAIEEEHRRGVQRFGPAFERGDYVAIFAIQDITIQLQGSLLKRLHEASASLEVADFRGLADASDIGQINTISALVELQQRLIQAAPITEMPTLRSDSGQPFGQPRAHRTEVPQHSLASAPPQSQYPPWENSGGLRQSPIEDGKQSSRSPRQRFAFFEKREQRPTVHAHRDSEGHPSGRPTNGPQRVFTLPADLPDAGHATPSNRPVNRQPPTFTYQEGEDNPFEIWGSNQNRLSTYNSAPNPAPIRSLSEGSDRIDTPMRALSLASTSSSTPTHPISHTSTSVSTPHPSPENDYLGFCKGAWRLQNGDQKKAVVTSTDWATRSAASNLQFITCSKCKFECHSNPKTIWKQVWTYESLGIKLRWPFLAKSHVAQKTALDRQAAKQCMFCYKCIFCVYEGLGGQAPVIHGLTSYLHHISQAHRGMAMSEVVLYKTKCINNHVCEDSEKFDINIFPGPTNQAARISELG